MAVVQKLGGRKFTLGMTYLIINGGLNGMAIWIGAEPEMLMSLALVAGASSTGVGAVVWGNVKEAQIHAENGSG